MPKQLLVVVDKEDVRCRRVQRIVWHGLHYTKDAGAHQVLQSSHVHSSYCEVSAFIVWSEWFTWRGVLICREELGNGIFLSLAEWFAASTSWVFDRRANCYSAIHDYRNLFQLLSFVQCFANLQMALMPSLNNMISWVSWSILCWRIDIMW